MARLEASVWPEVAGAWSRLTPSGFPVEVTVLPDRTWQWAAEVADPELPESDRLDRALSLLESTGPPLPSVTRQVLLSHQAGRDLRFGAWIAGRGDRLKVYAELTAESSGTPPAATAGHLPERVASALARLPAAGLDDLLPFLRATGHAEAPRALEEGLPDGLRRLSGRRLALSVAWTADGPLELALFVTARTLFPGHPQGLLELAPCLVTLLLDPAGRTVSTRTSVCPWPA
ncbi:hypothetical protein [Streptomyces acidiscabies]|uniref:hypothetical protein n=1 Tax=Streptomyces acidiscabies TaxID=42234 RepID=UPI0038F67370